MGAGISSNAALAEGNASNPLSAGNNVDFRWQHTTANGSAADFDKNDIYIDGAQMLNTDLKLKYEIHYNTTDITGTDQHGFESIHIKPLYFPHQAKIDDAWGVKTMVGFEWIADLGDSSKGIGVDADQIGPLVGAAFSNSHTGTVIIPIMNQFWSYNGSVEVNTTAGRLIVLQPFGDGNWIKADAKVPYDWVMKTWPATFQVEVGTNIDESWAVYGQGLAGLGNDRPYDFGVGAGLRFKY